MIWQDAVLGVGQFLFGAALIPSLLGPMKPAFLTSFATGVLLMVFAAAYWSMGLMLATCACLWCGALWLALAVQVGAPSAAILLACIFSADE